MKQTLLSFLLMFLPMLANAAIEIDGIYYNLDTDAKTAEVTRLNRNQKYSGDVMIPSSVTYEVIDYCVTSIARQAFYNCSELTSVTIPNSMTCIGNEAFRNCSNLTKVELNSNAMVSKDYDAGSSINEIFGSQVKEYVLGDEVTGIGNYAFFGCSNLISVHMSDYVTTIGEGAFSQCYQLTSFEMPNNVESIGTLAFNMCYSLTSITIPSSLTNLDYWTFPGCSGLTKVELNSNAIVSKDFGTSLGSYFGGQVEEYVLGEDFKMSDGITKMVLVK